MKYKLLALELLLSTLCFGQSQVKLKSGETVEGNIKSLINDVLTLTFKGNTLTFKQSDIATIYFVKPVQEETKSTVVIATPPAKAELKGVVTYYFNKNFGDKPDVGARIYLRKTDTSNGKRSLIHNYDWARLCRSEIGYTGASKSEIEHCTKLLKELHADTKEGFDKMNTDVFQELLGLDYKADVKKVTADGNGNYSISLEPGLYEVIFISKGRNDHSLAEIDGKIDVDIIYLSAGEQKVIDERFGF